MRPPYYDPTPARHTQGSLAFPLAGCTVEGVAARQSTGLARQHHENANLSHALNAAGLCLFGYAMLDYKSLPDFLAAADGTAWSIEELAKAGRWTWTPWCGSTGSCWVRIPRLGCRPRACWKNWGWLNI